MLDVRRKGISKPLDYSWRFCYPNPAPLANIWLEGCQVYAELGRLISINRLVFHAITYLLYQAAFDREPDEEGLGYWINSVYNVAPLIADGILYQEWLG